VMATWGRLLSHFGSNRLNPVSSRSTCANIKRVHTLVKKAHLTFPLLSAQIRSWREALYVIFAHSSQI